MYRLYTVCVYVIVCICGTAFYCYAGNAEPHPVVILEMALVLVLCGGTVPWGEPGNWRVHAYIIYTVDRIA